MPMWTIRVCSACGILVEDDRDYGGPLPIDADGCLESPRCGAILPRHEMPEGRDAFGAKACPGEKAVEVVPSDLYQGAVDALREVERLCAVAGGERSSSPVVVQIVKAARSGLGGTGVTPE